MEIVESSFIVPVEKTPSRTIWLSNLDLLVARSHTPTVYFYQSNAEPDDIFSVQELKVSLAKALVPFYPLAGRLDVDQTGRIEIRCSSEGVLFVVARLNRTLDDFGDFAPSSELRAMLVPSMPSGNPPCVLVMVQVTFFKCGGVCLGTAVHHAAVDGLAALHFINSWSDICRGNKLVVSPCLDRALLRARSPPNVHFEHTEYYQKLQVNACTGKLPFDSAILELSKDQVNLLKYNGGRNKGLSTFKAVVAHLWQSACKARMLKGGQETRLYMTADARSRMMPPLPSEYQGNAIFRTSAVAKVEEIISNSLEFGANKISQAIARLNNEYIRSLIDYLELQEDIRSLQKGSWVLPNTDLWIISWQGLPIYEADFGWGKPIYMGRACLQFSGLVYIMHNTKGDGGLSLAVAMEPENMQKFRNVFYEELRNHVQLSSV